MAVPRGRLSTESNLQDSCACGDKLRTLAIYSTYKRLVFVCRLILLKRNEILNLHDRLSQKCFNDNRFGPILNRKSGGMVIDDEV